MCRTLLGPPQGYGDGQSEQRDRGQPPEVPVTEPSGHQPQVEEREPAADQPHRHNHRDHQRAGQAPGQGVGPPFRLQDQPRTAEQAIASHQRGTGEHGKGTEPQEGAPDVCVIHHRHALHHCAQDHALRERCQQ
ncbi:hypothetical protein D3C72_1884430 [compost metagenome]